MVKLVNLTPHPITFVGPNNEQVTIPPDPHGPARCEIERAFIEELQVQNIPFPLPVRGTRLGAVVSLPEPQEGVVYVVSRQVAEAAPERRDLYVVDDTVRDEQGRVVGARGLARIS